MPLPDRQKDGFVLTVEKAHRSAANPEHKEQPKEGS